MEDEAELLRRFVGDNDQTAFAELVRRHVNLVYAAALRQVGGDAQLAEDVAQGVFLALARTAPRLLRHSALSGWLYTSTRFIAAKTLRAHRRWLARQQEAHSMQTLLSDTHDAEPEWHDLRPVIDDAMHELPAADREVILLRYFEGRPLAELSVKYGLAENSVRMRVDRALDRLRLRLARRGITSTAGALGIALAAQPAIAAPAGFAAAAASTSLAGLAAGGGAAAGLSFFAFMSTTKITIGVVAVLALSSLGYVTYENNHLESKRADEQRRQNAQLAELRAENLKLRTTNQKPVAAANIPPATAVPPPEAPSPGIVSGRTLTPGAKLASYLQTQGESVTAGFRAGILQSHAEIFQKLGMSPEQQDTYIQMRFQHMADVNKITEDAAAKGEDDNTTAGLVDQSTAQMWSDMHTAFGDATAAGLQEFVAAGRGGRGGPVAATAASMAPAGMP